MTDKENERQNANDFNLIKEGLREGVVTYDHLQLSSKLLDLIDTSEWDAKEEKKVLRPSARGHAQRSSNQQSSGRGLKKSNFLI